MLASLIYQSVVVLFLGFFNAYLFMQFKNFGIKGKIWTFWSERNPSLVFKYMYLHLEQNRYLKYWIIKILKIISDKKFL